MPGEVKVLTRTEYKTIKDETEQTPSMDVPKYPETEVDDDIGPDASDVSLDEPSPEETQSDKFERAMASDTEDTSSVAPEEAPPEIIPVEEVSDQ
ncbi:MAG: hypothetical protein V4598_13510 [Bdellovibrionota bacterium]